MANLCEAAVLDEETMLKVYYLMAFGQGVGQGGGPKRRGKGGHARGKSEVCPPRYSDRLQNAVQSIRVLKISGKRELNNSVSVISMCNFSPGARWKPDMPSPSSRYVRQSIHAFMFMP